MVHVTAASLHFLRSSSISHFPLHCDELFLLSECNNLSFPAQSQSVCEESDGFGDLGAVRFPDANGSRRGSGRNGFNHKALSAAIVGSVADLGVVVVTLLVLVKRMNVKKRNKGLEEDGFVPVLNLKVFLIRSFNWPLGVFREGDVFLQVVLVGLVSRFSNLRIY
ncbi:putative G-type lectin S-receptor-like serine/threonine-protein [Sesbania bispinosa]|nr:putative G-type lectin S-receptor-like serine/threonine-protein [Sesbania bispinosa]